MQPTNFNYQNLAAQFADQLFVAGLQRGLGEVEKTFHYFRSKHDRSLLFAMLCQRRKLQQPFAQNRNTAEYYDHLLSVICQFLKVYPTISDDGLLIILGWAIRLAKYRDRTRSGSLSPTGGFEPKVAYDAQLVQQICVSFAAKKAIEHTLPTAPQLPAVGDTFAGKVVAVDESAVLVAIPGFPEDKAVGVMQAAAMAGGRTDRYREGNLARVEVTGMRTLKSGRVIVELKPGARKQ